MINSAIGTSPTGISGLGSIFVYGYRRVPFPPAIITIGMPMISLGAHWRKGMAGYGADRRIRKNERTFKTRNVRRRYGIREMYRQMLLLLRPPRPKPLDIQIFPRLLSLHPCAFHYYLLHKSGYPDYIGGLTESASSPLNLSQLLALSSFYYLILFKIFRCCHSFLFSNMELAKKCNCKLFLSSTFLYRDEVKYIDRRVSESALVYGLRRQLPVGRSSHSDVQ